MTSQGRQAYCKVKGQSQSNKHLVEIVALYFSWVFPNCSLNIEYPFSVPNRIWIVPSHPSFTSSNEIRQ
ncbi:hypothetical protein SNOG_05281 [Parastagonospora nodorum SN15]|uniref:Uncharacterized protein n=1 Tax=Phaeosphaeria nodorum (strain SN15 / ATCC MYA-4574 / FGSC 10173) TaxID=321614 RepID=Q0USI3_PHANO|nr:hypothetical protein SNOG_05281 [Parastagonospora nodorum SN15]EAT87672.1 hypothetical protein SNOG_05281 [Parastagonospora nodorum SN15]